MDDTKLRAEFPIGKRTVIVTEPSEGQMFVLALSRRPADGDAAATEKLVRRLLRVLEALVGDDQWYNIIEDGMISEEISPDELVKLAAEVVRFDWSAHRPDLPQEDPAVVLGREQDDRPAPRIVTGG